MTITARQRLSRPATALVVMASIGLVFWAIRIISLYFRFARGVPIDVDPWGLAVAVLKFAILIVICIGSARMGHLKSYRMGWAAAILSCIPGILPFFVLGVPFGLWSIALLSKATTRSAFALSIAGSIEPSSAFKADLTARETRSATLPLLAAGILLLIVAVAVAGYSLLERTDGLYGAAPLMVLFLLVFSFVCFVLLTISTTIAIYALLHNHRLSKLCAIIHVPVILIFLVWCGFFLSL
ncbi:hypothetical protein [Rubripirellula obstinata]|uniref:hypothetical protein n=1 Tax=Rubripirellula obstinata TaxID=406547 RepID=UPI0013903A30|nr:hypothetical protein [Rubripirellula obstinata]